MIIVTFLGLMILGLAFEWAWRSFVVPALEREIALSRGEAVMMYLPAQRPELPEESVQ